MKAYSFGIRYEDEKFYHTGDAQQVDIDVLPANIIESIESGNLVRVDDPNGTLITYYHIDKEPIEYIYLGFWLANNYKYAFEQIKEYYNKDNSI
jgi:hypothetical protein